MNTIVRLYSEDKYEINKFLNNFYSDIYINKNEEMLEWQKIYPNPLELADIIGAYIENNDKYNISMWVSFDKGVFINVNDENADKIIRYLYERYPW